MAKIAIVTGGTRGIGAAISAALKNKGYSVGSADGVMGIKTRSMLIQYQKDTACAGQELEQLLLRTKR